MINRSNPQDLFTDLIDGTLSEADRASLEAQIAADPELAKAFAAFKAVVSAETKLANEPYALSNTFEDAVMRGIATEHAPHVGVRGGSVTRWYMNAKKVISALWALSTYQRITVLVWSVAIGLLAMPTLISHFGEHLPSDWEGAVNVALAYIQGSIGALALLLSALLAFSALVTGRFRVAGGLVTCCIALFMHRSLMVTFFNDASIIDEASVKDGALLKQPQAPLPADLSLGTQYPASADRAFTRQEKALVDFGEQMEADYQVAPPPSEEYIPYIENKRTLVRDTPVSTFSVDVDTASYSNTRRMLALGQLPPKSAVRAEEFLNYFSYNYPSQREKPFALTYEIAPSPFSEGRHILSVGVKARSPLSERQPWNLVFLVDVSGSMDAPNKLPLVKSSLNLLLDAMRADDRLAIVTYAGSSEILLSSTPGHEKEKIRTAIESLSAGGSTNGEGGIRAAYAVARKNMVENGVNRVVLATDGDFNVGISSTEQLVALIEEQRKSGVTLTTLGFGTGNYRDGVMEQLADKGNGNYFYIDSYREARKVLSTKLASTVEIVAKDVKLQIEFNPATVYEYRLIGYNNRILNKEDFEDDTVDAGEIGPDHTVTALYELVLADSPLAKKLESESRYQPHALAPTPQNGFPTELGFLKVRFKQPHSSTSELLDFPIDRSEVKEALSSASTDFRFASSVAGFAELLGGSSYAKGYTYADVEKLANSALGEDNDGSRREFAELVASARSIATR